ncbi:MAG: ATP-binding cassette domain-containing protein [Hyphomicrobiaceae bacterium]
MAHPAADPLSVVLKACRRHLTTAAAFGLALNCLHLAGPLYMMQVYDRVLGSGSQMTLVMLTVAVLAAYGALAGLDRARGDVMAAASLRLDRLLSGPAFSAMMRETDGRSRSQALRDLDACRQLVTSPAISGLLDLPWVLIYAVAVFVLHWALGLFTLVCMALLLGLAVLSEARLRASARETHASAVESHQWADQCLRNGDVARALGLLPDLVHRWIGLRRGVVTQQQLLAARTASMTALVRFLRLAMQSLVLGLGAWLAIGHAITPGAIFAASLLLGRALQPVEQVIGQWQTIIGARAAWTRLGNALDGAQSAGTAGLRPVPSERSILVGDQLGFAVGGRRAPLLAGLNFRVAPGECVGLIGPSGAGKSTLVRLMVGAAVPTTGALRFDGIPVDSWWP